MDSYKIILAPSALTQLNNYIDYIQYTLHNEQAAENVYYDAQETLKQLSNVAGSLQYCKNPELRKRGYRSINFTHHQYIMLYLIDNKNVYVEAIYHQTQNYESIFLTSIQ